MKCDNDEEKPKIEIGPLCPPIASWFFPYEKSEIPYQLEPKEIEYESSSQSS